MLGFFASKDVWDFLGIVFRNLTGQGGPDVVKAIAQVLQDNEAIQLADKMLITAQDAKAKAALGG